MKEDKFFEKKKDAEAFFEESKKTEDDVYLIMSDHWITEGYWAEFQKRETSVYDACINEFHKEQEKK
jgi:hypothetical protein